MGNIAEIAISSVIDNDSQSPARIVTSPNAEVSQTEKSELLSLFTPFEIRVETPILIYPDSSKEKKKQFPSYVNTETFFTEPVKKGKNVWVLGGQDLVENKIPLSANTYLIQANPQEEEQALGEKPRTKKINIVFDPGSAEGLPYLLNNLEQMDLGIGDLDYIFLTHMHRDHSGAVAELEKAGFSGKVCVPEKSLPRIQTADLKLTASDLYEAEFESFFVDEEIVDEQQFGIGDLLITAHSGDGHSDDSMYFTITDTDSHKSIIAGDCLWGSFREEFGSNPDLSVWERTLEKIESENPDELFAGHMPLRALPQNINALTTARATFGKSREVLFPDMPHEIYSPWQ